MNCFKLTCNQNFKIKPKYISYEARRQNIMNDFWPWENDSQTYMQKPRDRYNSWSLWFLIGWISPNTFPFSSAVASIVNDMTLFEHWFLLSSLDTSFSPPCLLSTRLSLCEFYHTMDPPWHCWIVNSSLSWLITEATTYNVILFWLKTVPNSNA
jgi:hypothetical protein